MKTIKVFLASGKEMKHDRNAFGNLIRKLDEIYEKRGTRIRLFEWEDVDSAYNGGRKQDEYNEHLRASDMFLALFHTYAGIFTQEEFNIAKDEREEKGTPKPYVYCRDLQEGEEEDQTLKDFKKYLFEKLKYFFCSYNSEECLNLQFVMQLQLFENTMQNEVKVENDDVTFHGIKIAKMDELQFVAQNKDYLKLRDEINELKDDIVDLRKKLEETPDDERLKDRLQQKLKRKNERQEEFTKYQQQILDIQKNIVKLQGEKISERIREAIEAFSQGDIRKADYILEDAKNDTVEGLNDFISSKEITEQKRKNVCQNIKELLLRADVVLADLGKDIKSRKKEAWDCYKTADKVANEVGYNKKDYVELLFRYGKFLNRYAYFKEAETVYIRLISLCEEIFGCNEQTAIAYNNIGNVYSNLGNYDKALDFYNKALEIQEKVLGKEHTDTAASYNNIGLICDYLGKYDEALKYHTKALKIRKKVLGEEHPDTATSYNNIGLICDYLGKYDEALKYHTKALKIRKKVLGEEHPDTAASYNNIGNVYSNLGNYDKALEYYEKALEIRKKVLGEEHPDTAASYNNIGSAYYKLGKYNKASKNFTRALEIRKKVLDEEHTDTAGSYNNIGLICNYLGKYDEALEYYEKALKIFQSKLGSEHSYTKSVIENISLVKAMQKQQSSD